MATCEQLSAAACFGIGYSLFEVCSAASSGACGALGGAYFLGLLPATCIDGLRGICRTRICVH